MTKQSEIDATKEKYAEYGDYIIWRWTSKEWSGHSLSRKSDGATWSDELRALHHLTKLLATQHKQTLNTVDREVIGEDEVEARKGYAKDAIAMGNNEWEAPIRNSVKATQRLALNKLREDA